MKAEVKRRSDPRARACRTCLDCAHEGHAREPDDAGTSIYDTWRARRRQSRIRLVETWSDAMALPHAHRQPPGRVATCQSTPLPWGISPIARMRMEATREVHL